MVYYKHLYLFGESFIVQKSTNIDSFLIVVKLYSSMFGVSRSYRISNGSSSQMKYTIVYETLHTFIVFNIFLLLSYDNDTPSFPTRSFKELKNHPNTPVNRDRR